MSCFGVETECILVENLQIVILSLCVVVVVVPVSVPVLVAQISWMHVEKQLQRQLSCF
jgi:hypothetical protein